jgi:hypothetical protein
MIGVVKGKDMRVWLMVVGLALTACAPASDQSGWDMGPMPPVAALYDRDGPPTTLEERSYYMTTDLAEALSAAETPIDFDWRTWAVDPEIEDQTFALSEHPPENRAAVVTRFSYPRVGGGMILTYILCRRGPSDWKIEDIHAESVGANGIGAQEAIPSLREMLGLPAQAPSCG